MKLPPDLEDRVRQGRVIPFAGAGVSMTVRSREGEEPLFPSWNGLLQRAATALDRNGKVHDAMVVRGLLGIPGSDPCLIAQHARTGLSLQWNDFLKEAFEIEHSQLDDRTLALPRLLWRLGSGLVVTTNYDHVLSWACPAEWKNDLDVLGVSAPTELSRLVSGRGRKPTLWHLHGHIGNATDIILTPDGYEQLYANDRALLSRHEDALTSLKGLLLTHTFLFVGFSFRDPYFGGQLAWLRRVFAGAPPQHYCLVPADEMVHLRELDLPVEPIAYEGHGEPLLATLRRISELAGEHPRESPRSGGPGEGFAWLPCPRRSLPADVTARCARHIVGRTGDFAHVRQMLLSGESPIYPVYGQPGVGKTALALQLASDPEIGEHYERGVFWVDLGPTPHLEADLDTLGVQLDIPREEMQQYATVEQKGARIRREIGKGKALLVLDNVWTDLAVRAFLVGGSASAHLLTTRKTVFVSLDPEAARHAHRLAELDVDSALDLLGWEVPGLIEAFPLDASRLVESVGRLPLGIIVVGRYLRQEGFSGQHSRLKKALEKLANPETRLRPPAAERMPATLWEAISLSYEDLSAAAQTVLRTVSALPPKPNTFSEDAALAAADAPVEVLYDLVDRGLIEVARDLPASGAEARLTVHQPVADFARHHLQPAEEADIYGRLARFYMALAEQEEKSEQDYSTLELERNNVIAAVQGVDREGQDAFYLQAFRVFLRYLVAVGLYRVVDDLAHRAQDKARRLGDRSLLASVLSTRAKAARKQGNYAQARELIEEGLAIARELQNRHLEAALLADLGGVVANLGDYNEADRLLKGAQRLAEADGRPEQLARVCRQRGSVATTLGHYSAAATHYQRGLALALDPRTEVREGKELASRLRAFLGELCILNGDYTLAERYLSAALKEAVALPSPEAECTALQQLGMLRMKVGSDDAATRCLADALRVAQRIFHKERTCFILGDLAYHLFLRGDLGGAIERGRESLALAQELRHSRLTAYARWILGQSELGRGDVAAANEELTEAHELAGRAGHFLLHTAALVTLGELNLAKGDTGMARYMLERALHRASAAGLPEVTAAALFGLARVARARQELEQAQSHALGALGLLLRLGHRQAAAVEQWLEELLKASGP